MQKNTTNMRALFTILSLVLITLFTQSCGTIIHGTTQEVGISSQPTNARVSINGEDRGSTPMIADLKRKNNYMVQIQLEGYQTYETNLTRSTSGWVWGNIVFGGLIGLVVDASAGGMYKLSPEQLNAELRSQQAEVLQSEEGLFIAVVLEPNPEWEKVGRLEAAD
jgi:hypothetical protein